jgi:Macrocin-O-methyltransferase (TylF)
MMETRSDAITSSKLNPFDQQKKDELLDMLFSAPIPKEELHLNLTLFLDRRLISRILFVDEIYRKILPIHGSILEFGVRYGSNLSLFTSMRGIHEPFNHNRKVVGFDTFEGFAGVDSSMDGTAKAGDFAVTEGYEAFLDKALTQHERMAPLENIRKFKLVKGDATTTIQEYLSQHQETVIALAYFDFDIYKPTAECLKAILPYLSRGAVIVFDECNDAAFPGETTALREVLGTNKFVLRHSPYRSNAAYLVFE